MIDERWKEVKKATADLEKKGWRVERAELVADTVEGTTLSFQLRWDPERPCDVL